jgi:hypothetical protein
LFRLLLFLQVLQIHHLQLSPTIESTPNPIPSPTITPTPTAIATPYVEVHGEDEYFEINKGSLKFDNGYDGKVLIIIDTYLLKEYIKSEEELNRMKRKVMILKDSYDELSEYEKEQLKKEYGEYSIFDPNTYKPIKEGDMKKNSTYEGNLSGGTIGFELNRDLNNSGAYIYGQIAYKKKEGSNIRDGIWGLRNSFSENLKQVHQNVKISNRKRLMKGPVQKIVFCSISFLSYYSELMYYTVNYFDDLEWTGFYGYLTPLSKKSRIWGIFIS